jgi:hypothetical protein
VATTRGGLVELVVRVGCDGLTDCQSPRQSAERLGAVRLCGFTARHAPFLVLVLEHSGVCQSPAFTLRFGVPAPVPRVCW